MSNKLLTRLWGLRKWKRLTSVVLRRLKISHFFTIHTSGIKLRFYPAVWNNNLWENPDKFKEDVDLLYRYLRAGNTVIDLGANVGFLSLVASRIIEDRGSVHAFEAHPRTFGFLKGNLEYNNISNTYSYNIALGNYDGEVTFTDNTSDDGNHITFEEDGIKVPVKPLDKILARVDKVHLLKIDVEGYEKFVFEGARKILAKTKCIYFESSSDLYARYGYTTADVISLLKEEGFSTYRIIDSDQIVQLRDDYISRDIENLMAVKDPADFTALTGFCLG